MPHFARAAVQKIRLRNALCFLTSILAALSRPMPVEERAGIVTTQLFFPM